MLRVISVNVNGLRASIRKGLFPWLLRQNADFICLQEVRIHETQLHSGLSLEGYQAYFCCAEKKGYSGVAFYTRYVPHKIGPKLGWSSSDSEGRYLQLDFGPLSIASLYVPSGSHQEARQVVKLDFLKQYGKILEQQCAEKPHFILCGDLNIAHKTIDIKNWKANQKNPGFLPEERAWMDALFEKMGYVDAFRVVYPEAAHHYTWWSQRGRAWDNNVGWRIDYQIVTPVFKEKVLHAEIYKAERFSDHAPLILDYDWTVKGFTPVNDSCQKIIVC